MVRSWKDGGLSWRSSPPHTAPARSGCSASPRSRRAWSPGSAPEPAPGRADRTVDLSRRSDVLATGRTARRSPGRAAEPARRLGHRRGGSCDRCAVAGIQRVPAVPVRGRDRVERRQSRARQGNHGHLPAPASAASRWASSRWASRSAGSPRRWCCRGSRRTRVARGDPLVRWDSYAGPWTAFAALSALAAAAGVVISPALERERR